MSQNLRNQSGENEDSGSNREVGHYHKEDTGFEGMNYEQPRQPYPSIEPGSQRHGKNGNCGNDAMPEEG